MEILRIDDNIIQFIFTKKSSDFSLNITALINNETAILIDLAYEKYAMQVKQYLEEKGISKFILFISHHHEDHFDGVKCFPDSTSYASGEFDKDFQEHLQSDEILKSFKPTVSINDADIFKFGIFEIKSFYTPGHNNCSFSFLINRKHLYVGDLIFYDKNGLPSLPYIDANSEIAEYQTTISQIEKIKFDSLIMGHGKFINDRTTIDELLNNHDFYLNKIATTIDEINVEKCLHANAGKYSGTKFHESNLLAAKRNQL